MRPLRSHNHPIDACSVRTLESLLFDPVNPDVHLLIIKCRKPPNPPYLDQGRAVAPHNILGCLAIREVDGIIVRYPL